MSSVLEVCKFVLMKICYFMDKVNEKAVFKMLRKITSRTDHHFVRIVMLLITSSVWFSERSYIIIDNSFIHAIEKADLLS